MKEKAWTAALVLGVAAIWVSAFVWFQDPPAADPQAASARPSEPAATASTTPSPAASPSPEEPSQSPDRGRLQARAAEVEERAEQAREADREVALDLRVATFNVLGHSHTTGRDRQHTRFGSGPARVPGLVRALEDNGVDVAGLQEFQPVQRAAFAGAAPGWSAYPTGSSFTVGTTSVVWRSDRFDLLEGRLTDMPFYDQVRAVPSVLLRDKETGLSLWVTSVHNPADTNRFPRQQRFREDATDRQAALVAELRATGVPSVITGDMNEKSGYYCRFSAQTGFTSPAGGSTAGGCTPPGDDAIDWIMGSPDLQWTSFTVDKGATVRRTSDHALRTAGARLVGRPSS